MKYKIIKLFDIVQMPEEVQDAFTRANDHMVGNCIINYQIADTIWADDEGDDEKLIDAWLIENGAAGPKDENSSGENVLIKTWW